MLEYILLGLGILLAVSGGIFLFFWFFRKQTNLERALSFTFLQVSIPKKESKEDLEKDRDQTSEIRKVIGIADQWYTSLHGIYSSDLKEKLGGQDYLSLEYIATDGEIKFIIGCPKTLVEVIEKQITSYYPEAIVEEIETPHFFAEKTYQETGYITADKDVIYPFKSYDKFESADPMNGILNNLSNASDEKGNAAAVQIMIRPTPNGWQKKVRKKSKEFSSGKKSHAWWNPFALIGDFIRLLVSGSEANPKNENSNDPDKAESNELTKMMEEKAEKVGFEVIIRCITSSPDRKAAQVNLNTVMKSFTQYGGPSINEFSRQKWHLKRTLIRNFLLRLFLRSWKPHYKIILTPAEIASMYHLPHIKYNNIPAVKWQNYKVVKAPSNIPKEGLLLGHNVYRGEKQPIYMKRDDRFRHFYVIGQTGTGKSSILQVMARQDMQNGDGMCIVDPHGSLVEDLLPYVPKERVDDVIIFNPADLERPLGLNLLEAQTEEEKDMVALDAMNIMLKMFDEETFGPRIQDYFRNGCLTLMSHPEGGCITDIVRLFTDDAYQRACVKHVSNPVVKSFWTKQMAQTGQREKQEMIPYFSAKFGAFVTNSMMRNIIGQRKSAFDFSKVMDGKKLLFMNLSKGVTGEINSKLLGLIIVSKIQMAALRRQKQLKEERSDFFLYIDEFQNYVTDSIESILSEARKYRLGLCIAHQYLAQIDTSSQKKGVNLKDAVFGNIGTMMCYKIGAQDAEAMAKEMAPAFNDQDLVNIDKYKAVMKLSIDTQPSKPFSITPVNPYLEEGNLKLAEGLKQISRLTHGRDKKFVEKEIYARLDV